MKYSMRRHLSIRRRYLDCSRLLSAWVFGVMTLFADSCCIRGNDQSILAPLDRHWWLIGYRYDGLTGEERDISVGW